jgi:nucleotide-binding universal stress UspA family protein
VRSWRRRSTRCDIEVVDDRVAGIVEAAKRHDANAVVVGSRGENALSCGLGSVAASVLTAAPCSVVVAQARATTA